MLPVSGRSGTSSEVLPQAVAFSQVFLQNEGRASLMSSSGCKPMLKSYYKTSLQNHFPLQSDGKGCPFLSCVLPAICSVGLQESRIGQGQRSL